jgi:hypothetical protein
MGTCAFCNKEMNTGRKYCSKKCQSKNFYLNNKEKIVERVAKWNAANPEKVKTYGKKAMLKYRTEKKDRFNKSIMKSYHKYKQRWHSRNVTYRIINHCPTKPINISKVCRLCESNKNVKLKFEVYPSGVEEIRQAIEDGLIYYLCNDCRKKK